MLHDALEDGIPLGNIDDEDQFFDLLVDELPESEIESADRIYTAVQDLTKQSDQHYESYVNSVTDNMYAFRVKLADIMQNIGDNPSPRQLRKYAKTKDFLVDKFNNNVPPGISANHWEDFKRAISDAEQK